MRFVVVDIAASATGALTILKSLHEYVKANSPHEWVFLLSDSYIKESENCKTILLPSYKKSRFKRVFFDLYKGGKMLNELKPDAVVNLQNTYIYHVKAPQVLYQDQPIPFQKIKKFSFFKRNELKLAVYQHLIGRQIKLATKKSDVVVVQTQWMREAAIRLRKTKKASVFVVAPNVSINEAELKKEQRSNVFFYPASGALYKNHDCIIKAVSFLEKESLDFVVELTISGEGSGKIKYLGSISHSEVLNRLNSSTLLFPSYIETFGLPLMEARKLGSVVLAADTVFAREILDGYPNAYFFDFDAPSQLADLMRKVIAKDIVRKEVPKLVENKNSWKTFHDICERATLCKKNLNN